MKAAAIILCIISCLFTLAVLSTDGPPERLFSFVRAGVNLFVPIFTIVVLSLRPAREPLRNAAIVANIVDLALVCYGLVEQYPHPDEEGFIPYVILVSLTPVVSIIALRRPRARKEASAAAEGGA